MSCLYSGCINNYFSVVFVKINQLVVIGSLSLFCSLANAYNIPEFRSLKLGVSSKKVLHDTTPQMIVDSMSDSWSEEEQHPDDNRLPVFLGSICHHPIQLHIF